MMERLRPDDHFMILLEGDETPMHIGSLLILEVPDTEKESFFDKLRAHLVDHLPQTPLLREIRQAPLSFDSDVWVRAENVDYDYHIRRHHTEKPMTDQDLKGFVADHIMTRLDLTRPAFMVYVLDNVENNRAALYIKVHHGVTDGIGFQTILGLLSDDKASDEVVIPPAQREQDLPSRHLWLAQSAVRFYGMRKRQEKQKARRKAAREALRDPAMQRPRTPEITLSGPTTMKRSYTMITLSFPRIKRISKALGATINDILLVLAGTAMREMLLEMKGLPEEPLVANAARSYRRPEHGLFGNRIVAIHPHLGTHIADHIERLHAVQESMALERRRTPFDEAMLNQPEVPFGPRTRRQVFAQRRTGSGTIIPGNITVSNVPGPAQDRYYAGFKQLSNHPTPMLGSGRPINFTSRRNADALDIGLMVDGEKIKNVEHIADLFRNAADIYERLANEAVN